MGNNIDNFYSDLEVGKEMEGLIAKRLKRKFNDVIITEGKLSAYDVVIKDINKTIEVKQDFRSITTGNIVAEVVMNGKQSALCLTKADMWAIVTGYKIYYIKPIKIWEYILKENSMLCPMNPDGDVNKTKLVYYLRKEKIEKYCDKVIELKNTDPEYVINFVEHTYKTHNYRYLNGVDGLEKIWGIVLR